jgi:hypothetical protein
LLLRTHAPLVVASMALFFAIGGPSLAADAVDSASKLVTGKKVKNSSLTGKDIKNSSLTTSDVKNRSLLAADFKSGQLPAGAKGETGSQGPQGEQGAKGVQGERGEPGPFPDPLTSGKTLRGTWGLQGQGVAGAYYQEWVSYGFTLASRPTPYLASDAPAGQCTGSVANPTAAPGTLCVYEQSRGNVAAGNWWICQSSFCAFSGGGGGTPFGFGIQIGAAGAGSYWSRGTWAVTAP